MNLRELIAATRGDRSYAKLAKDAGGVPGHQRWQQLGSTQQRNAPEAASVKGIARALRVSEATVWLAAGEEIGVDVRAPESRLIALMPPGTDELGDAEIAAVLTLIHSLIATRRSGERGVRKGR